MNVIIDRSKLKTRDQLLKYKNFSNTINEYDKDRQEILTEILEIYGKSYYDEYKTTYDSYFNYIYDKNCYISDGKIINHYVDELVYSIISNIFDNLVSALNNASNVIKHELNKELNHGIENVKNMYAVLKSKSQFQTIEEFTEVFSFIYGLLLLHATCLDYAEEYEEYDYLKNESFSLCTSLGMADVLSSLIVQVFEL